MIRKIVHINEEKCTGCGLCAKACHEGAIQMIDNKARLIKDDYCDGLGDCLPHCPADAITIIEREAKPYDEAQVVENIAKRHNDSCKTGNTFSCPGSAPQTLNHDLLANHVTSSIKMNSELMQWPCQIKLVPSKAPYFDKAHLLIAADCTAYAYSNFHHDFMQKRITLIGCPKLDNVDYTEKLAEILCNNDIRSITLVRMEVPCCGGLEFAVKEALKQSGKMIPWSVRIISIKGEILECF